jgi:hypothetical protein
MSEAISFPLEHIPLLEWNNWAEFHRRAREWLILAGYDDVLENETPPKQEDEEEEAALQKRTKTYNARACTAIRSRCGIYQRLRIS